VDRTTSSDQTTDDRGVPDADDLRRVVDAVLDGLGRLPDDAWDAPAHRLAWTCRHTAAHAVDDLAFYAMQLSGTRPPQSAYVPLVDPPQWQSGGPEILFWPDPAAGTAGVVECLDATAGLLCAVVATAPPDRRGFHPRGLSDASGFAAMGVVEAAVHGWDVLTAHDVSLRVDGTASARTLDRLFPGAARTDDPWQDLLAACGRTPATRDAPWAWDSSVRERYGPG
jgi:hypothetical protein